MKPNSGSLWLGGIAVVAICLFFYSCQKETSAAGDNIPAGQQKVSVYLADGPTDYQQVLIDIQQIAVKVDTCHRNGDDDHDQPGCDDDHDQHHSNCEIWDTLNINPGVYDLLKLRNGLDTLLASGFTINGKILRIKLTLGTNNSVMADSVIHPLHLINNQNFVYVNILRQHLDSLTSNNFQLYLDFDLQHSIFYIGGQYWLKPVLKPFSLHSFGEIEGKVRPVHSFGLIQAYNATDTGYALPFDQGEFKIRGLKAGTYSVLIKGANGYKDSTISNVTVVQHQDTQVGTIVLHQ
ncbi:MAG: DUF4382 domain-containing protein [Bacteroidetes bacterium]|nr:DUF4382 domain-containing protein [Bacteroidota bacterium]